MNTEYLRAYRHRLINERPEILDGGYFPTRGDFFDLSRCKDLLFPEVERRFTIPEIAALLRELNLEFHGMETSMLHCEALNPKVPTGEAAKSLDAWHEFEQRNPTAFGDSLYDMWLRKPE